MFSEYDVVKLKQPKAGLPAGAIGAIVMVYDSLPRGYDVEFTNAEGVTLALLTLGDDDLEAVQSSGTE
jgi:Domain of unknown function (DUF4926)